MEGREEINKALIGCITACIQISLSAHSAGLETVALDGLWELSFCEGAKGKFWLNGRADRYALGARRADGELFDWCEGEIPVEGGWIKVSWHRKDGKIEPSYSVPEGWRIE